MTHSTKQGFQLLNGFKKLTLFDQGIGARLPAAYKKFWKEWKETQPAAVHYIPKEGEWHENAVTGEIRPVQSIPIPLIDTPESHQGIWGGEAIIKGFQKRSRFRRRVPHFWVPVLKRSVVRSVILDEYMSVVLTDRTLEKIHESHGFDHYLLKNLACDLRSKLALTLKRKILQELLKGCPKYTEHPNEQQRILNEYKCYLEGYTPEEIDWYGYTFSEAVRKLEAQIHAENPIVPHKHEFRLHLIEQLKKAGIKAIGNDDNSTTSKDTDLEALTKLDTNEASSSKWLSKINPFGKKQET